MTNLVSCIFLIILTIITTAITYYKVIIQAELGVLHWDTFVYLVNALRFADMGVVGQMHLAPLIPFLTSLFFRLGYVSETTLFILDGVLFVIGVIGLYLLFKLRYNEIQSFTGAVIFATFSVVLAWVAAGGIVIASVTFSIWTLYFTILAVKKDPKYFYLAFPAFTLAFLTRYTAGLIIFPMIFYVLVNGKFLKIKEMIIGALAGFIIFLPFALVFYYKLGNPFPFIGQLSSTATESAAMAQDIGYNPNTLYYIKNLLNYVSSYPVHGSYYEILNPSQGVASYISYIIIMILIIGLILYIYNIIKNAKNKYFNKTNYRINVFKLLLLAILVVVFILSFAKTSYIISEVIFFVISYTAYMSFKDFQIKIDMDLFFLMWFMVYFIAHSVIPIKDDRYFITMAPAFAYLVLLGLNEISEKLRISYKNKNVTSYILSLILVVMVLSSASAYFTKIPHEDPWIISEKSASEWLKNYDPSYKDKIIVSDRGPVFSWYLKKSVTTRIYRYSKSPEEFSNILESYNANYYIYTGSEALDIPGYHKIKTIRIVVIYEKNSD